MLKDINRILFLDLRPWLLSKEPMVKFKLLLQELEQVQYNHQPVYDVDWKKAINTRQMYYLQLIENNGDSFLNTFQSELKETKDEREKYYLIRSCLTELLSHMKDWVEVSQANSQTKDATFVFDAVQHQLARLYLEVQENKQTDILSIDEVYENGLASPAPSPEVIIDAPVMDFLEKQINREEVEAQGFEPILDDFRSDASGILSYDTIIKNPKRFASLKRCSTSRFFRFDFYKRKK